MISCSQKTETNPPSNTSNTSQKTEKTPDEIKSEVKNGKHQHIAPHGGTLVVLGEEFAHLELVIDSQTGKLTAFVLDGEAEKSVRIKQSELEIEVEKPSKFSVKLEAFANPLTGESKGDTSEFRGESEKLKGLADFDAKIKQVSVKGQNFKDIHFNFPKGNEEKSHHH